MTDHISKIEKKKKADDFVALTVLTLSGRSCESVDTTTEKQRWLPLK